jgi:hypothetical protein
MTVTPHAERTVRQAPRWLQLMAGALLFAIVWFGVAFAGQGGMPWLLVAVPIAGFAAWIIVRLASKRTALLLSVVAVACAAPVVVLSMYSVKRAPADRASSARPSPPPPVVSAPSPEPAPQPSKPVPPPASASSPIPQFPWPPPAASASYVLPASLFEGRTSLGQVTASIIAALERQGYVERSFFRTAADGVALVTRLERINDDGSPVGGGERWPAGLQDGGRSTATLGQLLRGLFYVDPGRYRVIVFIVQDAPFSQSSERITGDQARIWLRTGANILPRDVAERPFTGSCTALVYEFASDGAAVRVIESRLTGRQHLEKAGVLAGLAGAN